MKPRHVGHQRVRRPLVGAAGQPLDVHAVIFAKLLGEVVVTVDQRRRLEDAVDPRLDLGIDRLALQRGEAMSQCAAIRRSGFVGHGRGLGTAAALRNPRGLSFARRREDESRLMSDLEETMHFDPEEGSPISTTHLDRLKAAAEAQGFRFDRHAARNELAGGDLRQATGAAIARLLLSPTGAMAIEVNAAD